MKSISVFILLILFFTSAHAQSMAAIFKMLPLSCSPDLNAGQKSILLKHKTYTLPGSDSVETIKYELEINEAGNYLRFENYYTTGQRAFTVCEIRKFTAADGTPLIICSKYSGMARAYDQSELFIFTYRQNKLLGMIEQLLPQNLEITEFLKPGTPDSIKTKLAGYISSCYNLKPGRKNTIAFRIFFEVPVDDYSNYIAGNTLLFTWTGESFTRSIIHSDQ